MDSDEVATFLSRAASLYTNFQQDSKICDINQAIVLDRKALNICVAPHPKRPACLNQLVCHLYTRFNRVGNMGNVNEAIVHCRDGLSLCPPEHPLRVAFLNNLAIHLCTRYEQLGKVGDLDEAIAFDREALALRPPGHPGHSMSLNNLAGRLCIRYNLFGRVEDLDEAIALDRRALETRPAGHPSRSISLNNLAADLHTRYNQLGDIEDLDEAIAFTREALSLGQPGHPDRSMPLNNLSLYLWSRYRVLGGAADLDDAIVLIRDAFPLFPTGHPLRSVCLNNAALYLSARYEQLGCSEDLDEAIRFDQDALALRPQGHPDRSTSLTNLSAHLAARYGKFGEAEDLRKAVQLDREALALRPHGHPLRSTSLNNLAVDLCDFYECHASTEDLDEAIELDREALALRPPGHPERSETLDNLASHLWNRYSCLGNLEDLDEAIVSDRAALELRPPGHPYRSSSFISLVKHLSSRHKRTGDEQDQEEIFRLYTDLELAPQTVTLKDLKATKAWIYVAEEFNHRTLVLAYEMALRLLTQHIVALPSLSQHLAVLKDLSSSLAVDAFSACLRNQSPTKAVELLEQGRCVFWGQLMRLRSPLDEVIAYGPEGKTLASEFAGLTSLIRIALTSTEPDRHDRVCHLNLKLQRVVSNIRNLPGLSRFLLPSLFSDLQHAASNGPVIIVNASGYGCNALIVLGDRDPIHVPLSISKAGVRELSSKLATSIKLARKMDMTKDLPLFLRELWDKVVSPIVDSLQRVCPCQSRVWWCPTGEFSLLPLHAANPYRMGQQGFSNLYISSYTPTLTALIHARRQQLPKSVTERRCFLAIGQAIAPGASELFCVGTELDSVCQALEGVVSCTRIEGEEACVSRVTEELDKHQWVHISCHGIAKKQQPFESAFALRDGHFTIQHLTERDLTDPEFAYLSACHTTVGDEESPDEVIHLAAAMQFAGFRSVIGTMWAVDDATTEKITSVFYKHMVDESGRLDHTRAARALGKTMRSMKIPLDQRILYIHLGA